MRQVANRREMASDFSIASLQEISNKAILVREEGECPRDSALCDLSSTGHIPYQWPKCQLRNWVASLTILHRSIHCLERYTHTSRSFSCHTIVHLNRGTKRCNTFRFVIPVYFVFGIGIYRYGLNKRWHICIISVMARRNRVENQKISDLQTCRIAPNDSEGGPKEHLSLTFAQRYDTGPCSGPVMTHMKRASSPVAFGLFFYAKYK